MKLTRHAKRQAQRRGIETGAIDLMLSHGEDIQAKGGCRIYRLPYKELRYLEEECPPMLWRRFRDRLHRMATVVHPETQTVVTVMHRYNPVWKRFR